jgi:hypothetical protein
MGKHESKKIKSLFHVKKPCFGLDFERDDEDEDFIAAKGYKTGGPKEARLFRVALLGAKKDINHLFPIKVSGVPNMIKEEELAQHFSQFGSIGDIYVPRDGASRKLVAPFAIIRYHDRKSADNAISQGKMTIATLFGGPKPYDLEIVPLGKQESQFGQNSGVHGITNEITDTMIATQRVQAAKKEDVTQVVTLEECFSRSGYPWGSKSELKILQEHAPREVMHMYNIIVTNLSKRTKPAAIRKAFERISDCFVGDVYCPMPIVITIRDQQKNEYNQGFGYVRFKDRRDMEKGMLAIKHKLLEIDGHLIEGEYLRPYSWPHTWRRYF